MIRPAAAPRLRGRLWVLLAIAVALALAGLLLGASGAHAATDPTRNPTPARASRSTA